MVYYMLVFLLVFLIFIFPIQVICIQRKSWLKYGRFMNKIWSFIVSPLTGHIIVSKNRRYAKQHKGPVLIVANHSSYVDIPIMVWTYPTDMVFMGKAELGKLPIFGYMFRSLYITVNRSSRMDSYRSFKKAQELIQQGKSIMIFPEGTIPEDGVRLGEFKSGAFALAVSEKIPILAMTIIGSRQALEDPTIFRARPKLIRVIYHEPIIVTNQTEEELKQQVYHLIDSTLP